ncbi:hypothetical protein [Litchfieldia alkalitelluris]|uniref:hypothetical protein n=1 Tax=Litchfieldia alkalitelluris TaxID=304268 RepID=UPI00099650C2|nr:hypothetical protein [Litchfieldia alkalitelluris]
MKNTNLVLFVLILSLYSILLNGCDSPEPTNSIDLMDVENEVLMPDEMPGDFNFSLKYGVGALNEINTFKNSYTKDLVEDGTITTDLTFSKNELRNIYSEMKRPFNILPT